MRVLKFGGTSVATAERIARVAALVAEAAARERTAVVVSALAGVTDALVEAADAAPSGEQWRARVDALELRHFECLDRLAATRDHAAVASAIRARLVDLRRSLAGAASRRRCSRRERDSIIATGERLSAPLVTAALRSAGIEAEAIDARELIRTDSRFGEARVDSRVSGTQIRRRLGAAGSRVVPVVTGFIGADTAGRTTTLGRGGSDYSASIVGAATGAGVVEIWTDVDGVLSGPPRLVAGARTVGSLTYEEAAELAFFGARVLHRDTMRPLAALGIPIAVRNTFSPEGTATRIARAPSGAAARPAAVTTVERVELLIAEPCDRRRASPHGIDGELVEAGIDPLAASRASAGGGISVAVHADRSDQAVAVLRRGRLVHRHRGLSLVAVVGHGLGRAPGLVAAALAALTAARVPLVAMWAGASLHSFAALVGQRDLLAALTGLHDRVVISPSQAESRDRGRDRAGSLAQVSERLRPLALGGSPIVPAEAQ